jgi:hypothetical protein
LVAAHRSAQFLDDADGLMADDAAALDLRTGADWMMNINRLTFAFGGGAM